MKISKSVRFSNVMSSSGTLNQFKHALEDKIADLNDDDLYSTTKIMSDDDHDYEDDFDEIPWIGDMTDQEAFDLFNPYFDKSVSINIRQQAANILKDWYAEESDDPEINVIDYIDRTDIIELLDAASDPNEASIVAKAMDSYSPFDDDEDEEW